MKKVLGVIPSRLKSTRIINKPIFEVLNIPLILHVWYRASKATLLDDLIVATDSSLIKDLVESVGGKAILTSEKHINGTERMAEVVKLMPNYDYYTLINGDEILLNPDSVDISIKTMIENIHSIDATILAVPFIKKDSPNDFKIVTDVKGNLLYISRSDIPSEARNNFDFMLKAYHLMTFKKETVLAYSELVKSYLESIEDHEHLRLIENGYKIRCKIVDDKCISLDSLNDLETIVPLLEKDKIYQEYAK